MRERRALEITAFLLLVLLARGRAPAAPAAQARLPAAAARAAPAWIPPAPAPPLPPPTCDERLAACREACGLDPIPFADPAGEAERMAAALAEATRGCPAWAPTGTIVDCAEQPCIACRAGPSGDDDALVGPLMCPGVRGLSNAVVVTRTGPATSADGRGPPRRIACAVLDPAADARTGPRVDDRMDALMAGDAGDTGADTGG